LRDGRHQTCSIIFAKPLSNPCPGDWTHEAYTRRLFLHILFYCGRFEAIMVSNLVVKLAFLPLAVMTQKQAPIAAVSGAVRRDVM